MTWNNGIIQGQGFGALPVAQNYANSDERLLEDKNRPRDEYGFRLQPGRQMDKQDWRGTNKNIDFKQYIVSAIAVMPASPYAGNIRGDFKESFTAADLSFIPGYTPVSQGDVHPISWWQDVLKVQKRGEAGVTVDGHGNVVFLKAGSYIIQGIGQFIYPSGYSTSNSYQYKEYVTLQSKDDQGNWVVLTKNQGRACATDDVVTVFHVTWADKGSILNMGVSHTYGSNVMVRYALNIYKLS